MGRSVSPANRLQAIAFWRALLSPALSHDRLTATAVAKAIQASGHAVGRNKRLLQDATVRLQSALAGPVADAAAELDSWIADSLVDKGKRLLISPEDRVAVFATVRDRSRRSREAAQLEKLVVIRITETTAKLLRLFRDERGYETSDQAIAALILAGRRRRPPAPPSPPPGLFATNEASPEPQRRSRRQRKG